MIQLNLLPDVKLEYLKAERTRRLTTSIAILVALAAVGLLIISLLIDGVQYKHLKDLSKSIANESSQLQQKPGIDRVLTVQNQLESLTSLHNQKPAAARLFDFLNQVTPTQVSINSLDTDFTQQTISIAGSADSLASVNKYIDTLKFTTYSTDSTKGANAFKNVVLSSFGVGSNSSGQHTQASYTITLSYDPPIFDNTQNVKLSVPSEVTTRSAVEQPSDLFQAAATNQPSGGNQ